MISRETNAQKAYSQNQIGRNRGSRNNKLFNKGNKCSKIMTVRTRWVGTEAAEITCFSTAGNKNKIEGTIKNSKILRTTWRKPDIGKNLLFCN